MAHSPMNPPIVPLPAVPDQAADRHILADRAEQQGYVGKLAQHRPGQLAKLRRVWASRWVHPLRKAYIYAFVDATLTWLIVFTLVYITALVQVLYGVLDWQDGLDRFQAYVRYFVAVCHYHSGLATNQRPVADCTCGRRRRCLRVTLQNNR